MRAERVVLLVTLLWVGVNSAHVITKRRPQFPMLQKMDEISRHLRELTASIADFDKQLREAVVADKTTALRSRLIKRSMFEVDDSVSCRLSLRADFCDALDLIREQQGSYLQDPASPGKRSGESADSKYRKIVEELGAKRKVMGTLNQLFTNAGNVINREKRWFTCNLNLGFTCQTQEYNAIADYYDFLNSANSPGKKRSYSAESADVPS